jgi:hypothetical protein
LFTDCNNEGTQTNQKSEKTRREEKKKKRGKEKNKRKKNKREKREEEMKDTGMNYDIIIRGSSGGLGDFEAAAGDPGAAPRAEIESCGDRDED